MSTHWLCLLVAKTYIISLSVTQENHDIITMSHMLSLSKFKENELNWLTSYQKHGIVGSIKVLKVFTKKIEG